VNHRPAAAVPEDEHNVNPNVVARTAVAAIGVVVLVLGALGATSAFRSAIATDPVGTEPGLVDDAGTRELARVQHAQFECIRADLEDVLDPGQTVFVPLDPGAPDPDLWKQRLTEMAFPLATIVDQPGPGVTTLTVAPDTTGEGCTGVLLVTTPGAGG
jgi:hypothetical protein